MSLLILREKNKKLRKIIIFPTANSSFDRNSIERYEKNFDIKISEGENATILLFVLSAF